MGRKGNIDAMKADGFFKKLEESGIKMKKKNKN